MLLALRKRLNGKQRFVEVILCSQDFDFASDDEIIQKYYNLAIDGNSLLFLLRFHITMCLVFQKKAKECISNLS